MRKASAVAAHYEIADILERIKAGLKLIGKSAITVTVDDLSQVDEFHIGGRIATSHFFGQLDFKPGDRVLDIGCGIGGAARFAAARYGARVEGIDLTESYIETGKILNEWVGLENKVYLTTGDATSLEYSDDSFERAFSMHVCMNIEDKAAVFREAFRVLKSGAILGVYDVTRYSEGEIAYPVPWAADGSTSFLADSSEYVEALDSAGFRVEAMSDRHEFAVDYFKTVSAKMADAKGPLPLGVHVLMGTDAELKVKNLTNNLAGGIVAPFEFVARKP